MNRVEQAAAKLAQLLMNAQTVPPTPTDRVARMAYVQAQLAQASAEAIVELLAHKNIISASELDRFLIEKYETARARYERPKLIVPAGSTGLNGGGS